MKLRKKIKVLKSDLKCKYKISLPKIKFLKGRTDFSRLDSDHMTRNIFIVLVSTICFVARSKMLILISKKLLNVLCLSFSCAPSCLQFCVQWHVKFSKWPCWENNVNFLELTSVRTTIRPAWAATMRVLSLVDCV